MGQGSRHEQFDLLPGEELVEVFYVFLNGEVSVDEYHPQVTRFTEQERSRQFIFALQTCRLSLQQGVGADMVRIGQAIPDLHVKGCKAVVGVIARGKLICYPADSSVKLLDMVIPIGKNLEP